MDENCHDKTESAYTDDRSLNGSSGSSCLKNNVIAFFLGAAVVAATQYVSIDSSLTKAVEVTSFTTSDAPAIDIAINPTRPSLDARQDFKIEGWGNQTRNDGWPSFHFEVFHFCPHLINFMYENQVHPQSRVDPSNVIYDAQHPGALAEDGFAEVLQQTLPKFYDYPVGYRLNDRPAEISAYWTLHMRIARGSEDSQWHDFASSLPEGINRIYVKKPLQWNGDHVTLFSSQTGYNILVY